MNDSTNEYLRPGELGAFLGVGERQTRKVLGELGALGFKLEVGTQGSRYCPPALAGAVKAARERGKELAVLRLDPALAPYLARDARGAEPDALDVLVFVAAEHAILREAVGSIADSVRQALPHMVGRTPNWRSLGVPDPRNGL